jgi:transposase
MCSRRKKMEKLIGNNDFGTREGDQGSQGNASEYKRWSAHRKKDAVLRMICGEPVDSLSRELSIEICRLEEWHERALQGMEDALKLREGDSHLAELEAAMRRIGEISLENEMLRERIKKQSASAKKRARR